MKTLLINVSLFIISIILGILFFGIGFIIGLGTVIFKSASTNYFRDIALCIDILGNVSCRYLFNLTLIKIDNTPNRFGKVGETISSVLGKNQLDDNLTDTGLVLVNILDFLEKDHCLISINNDF
jgi:hypothetical protein